MCSQIPKYRMNMYKFPPIDLLNYDAEGVDEVSFNKLTITHVFSKFGIGIERIELIPGPAVSLYEVFPTKGSKVYRVPYLRDTMSMCIASIGVRIIAPLPGKGTIGVEIPNKNRQTVSMRRVIHSIEFLESYCRLPIALGVAIYNVAHVADLSTMPHLLICGSSGQGKTVCLNSIIISLLNCKSPYELKFILMDVNERSFTPYNKLSNHYLAKAPNNKDCIISDINEALYTLKALCAEMYNRYKILIDTHSVSIQDYNEKIQTLHPLKTQQYMPYIAVVIDEYSHLMRTSGKEVDTLIAFLAERAHIVGIHLIIATQYPVASVITDSIKAFFTARIFFKVKSEIRSDLLYDIHMVRRLIGSGDMLICNNAPAERIQGVNLQVSEIEAICDYIAQQPNGLGPYLLPTPIKDDEDIKKIIGVIGDVDEVHLLFTEVAKRIAEGEDPKIELLQKQFSIGYNKASEVKAKLRSAGLIGLSKKNRDSPK